MKRTPVTVSAAEYPLVLHPYLADAVTYDSSCSREARVLYLEKDGGFYLKSAAAGSLHTEAEMTAWFHGKGLGAEVLEYCTTGEKDYLLTARVVGEDLTDALYLSDPKRLAETTGALLRALHETDPAGCPVPDRMAGYARSVAEGYGVGRYDPSYLMPRLKGMTEDEVYAYFEAHRGAFVSDTVLHGDYCLPNVMLDGWRFSGFIDVGNGGVGDRHVDLYWGAWTLAFNLGTDRYRERFFDAYGRDRVSEELIDAVSAAEAFG